MEQFCPMFRYPGITPLSVSRSPSRLYCTLSLLLPLSPLSPPARPQAHSPWVVVYPMGSPRPGFCPGQGVPSKRDESLLASYHPGLLEMASRCTYGMRQ